MEINVLTDGDKSSFDQMTFCSGSKSKASNKERKGKAKLSVQRKWEIYKWNTFETGNDIMIGRTVNWRYVDIKNGEWKEREK